MSDELDGMEPRPREALWQSERHNVLETIEGNDPDLLPKQAYEPPPAVHRGDEIGRYVVLEHIGSGGMGVVFSAYDPKLDRKVALKLLRPEGSGAMRSMGRARLLREAQTTARLNHPNIVTIHDVGTVDDRVFLAMEYVQGQTLTHWQREERSTQELVEVYLSAGRGVAAAHRSGLVHRDFKPDNVIVCEDGQVRVLDFGIAQDQVALAAEFEAGSHDAHDTHDTQDTGRTSGARREAMEALEARASEAPDAAELNPLRTQSLTETGTIVGTPAYMAPEQHLGMRTDARSDQFSFCVAMWEGLFGERPFAGETRPVLALQVTQGNVRPPSSSARAVPVWLRKALERGLRADPEARHADMDALLGVLRGYGAPPKRRGARVLLMGALAGALGLAAWGLAGDEDPCGAVTQPIERVWNPARSGALEARFEAAQLSFGGDAFSRTVERVDQFAEQWRRGRSDACRATVVRQEQSAEAMDLRMACLDRRLREMDAQLSSLETGTGAVIEHAVDAIDALLSPASCDELASLRAQTPLPEAPELRAKLQKVDADLLAIESRGRLGGAKKSLADARVLASRAQELGFRPIEARAHLLVGGFALEVHEAQLAKDSYRQALLAAQASGAAVTELQAWTGMLAVYGDANLDLKRGHEVAQHGRALLEREGRGTRLEVNFLLREGEMLDWEGKYEAAMKSFLRAETIVRETGHGDLADVLTGKGNVLYGMSNLEDALAAYNEAYEMELGRVGPHHPDVGTVLGNLGIVFDDMGKRAEAKAKYRAALRITEAAYGRDSLETATYHNNLAGVLFAEGDNEGARKAFEMALTLWSSAQGHEVDVAMTLGNLALVDNELGEFERALRRVDRALDVYKSQFGEVHRSYANALHIRARSLVGLGRRKEGLALHAKGLELRIASLGADHLYVGDSHMDYANALLEAKQPASAREHYARALELRSSNYEGAHREITDARVGLAIADLALKRPDEARGVLEVGLVALVEDEGEMGLAVAEARFALARALWLSGGDEARARALAEQSLGRYADGDRFETLQAEANEVRAWLRKHRG